MHKILPRHIYIVILTIFISFHSHSQTSLHDSLFVQIKGGKFIMGTINGDSDESPEKIIKLESFYIGIHEVTNEQYCRFLNELQPDVSVLSGYINLKGKWKNLNCKIYRKDSVYYVEEGFEHYPVIFVSWYGADAYCKYYGLRLPTEAEWEYAASGRNSKFRFLPFIKRKRKYSDFSLSDVSWFENNSENNIHKIMQKFPNPSGIYDMQGNVAEWCNDWYAHDYYNVSKPNNPKGPKKGDFKSYRGGSWVNSQKMLRIKNRRAANPRSMKSTIGFRVVKSKI